MSDTEVLLLVINPYFYVITAIIAFLGLVYITEAKKSWDDKTLTWGELFLILLWTLCPFLNIGAAALWVCFGLFYGIGVGSTWLIATYSRVQPLGFLCKPVRR